MRASQIVNKMRASQIVRWSFMSVVQSSYRGPHDSNYESKKHSVLPVHLCVYSVLTY